MDHRMTRRALLARGALAGAGAGLLGGSGAALAAGRGLSGARHAARRRVVPLPDAAQVRRDFTKMVDFGPRLTGSRAHTRYVEWLEREFQAAGLELEPCDTYTTDRWLAKDWGLELLSGGSAGRVPVATYFTRSALTAKDGVTAPLVYGGAAPPLSTNSTNLTVIEEAIKAYPAELSSWAAGLAGTLDGGAKGSILLVDLPMPLAITAGAFLPLATYLHWPGHSEADWATSDYKRTWIEPGVGFPLTPFADLGAVAVVGILDASFDALKGGYLPFCYGTETLPALLVDRDTGERLRSAARERPRARLTLAGTVKETPVQTVTAILPGESDEVTVFNSHTDGQGFAEENAGVAFVHLARHFASLPRRQRLKRTLVFALWPGHMTYDLPETQGWIDAHPEIVKRTACALTVEHLGCTEWEDSLDGGYRATGQAELFGIWTTQGAMFDIVKASVIAHDIPRAALLRPPVQFGVGGAFQSSGVPQIGAIAGPEYLVTISENGDLDKLDEHLAARQITWVADLARQLDTVSAAELRKGDPTLGLDNGDGPSTAREEACVR